MAKKKIIIIDDEPLLPTLIKELLEAECPEFEVSEIVTDKNQFLDLVARNSYDVALIDISIKGQEGGIDLLRIVKEQALKLPVVILSAHEEMTYAAKCLRLGASGYVNKVYICGDLVRGLRKVLKGELFVSGNEGEQIVRHFVS